MWKQLLYNYRKRSCVKWWVLVWWHSWWHMVWWIVTFDIFRYKSLFLTTFLWKSGRFQILQPSSKKISTLDLWTTFPYKSPLLPTSLRNLYFSRPLEISTLDLPLLRRELLPSCRSMRGPTFPRCNCDVQIQISTGDGAANKRADRQRYISLTDPFFHQAAHLCFYLSNTFHNLEVSFLNFIW